jgi:hypothetical protein
VYDLMLAPPHEPPDARYTAEEFARYREGYDYALVIALRTLKAAEARFRMFERTKRLEARRKAGK